MDKYKYVIIGGGMTGSAAVSGIRKNDLEGTIAMFTKEEFGPYNRPPLTKGLWSGMQITDIMRPTDIEKIDLFLNTPITQVEPIQKYVVTHAGKQFTYEKLLLATGGYPVHLQGTPEDVIYLRTRADYEKVRALADAKCEFCVIGGGFIGSEIAAALNKHDCQVTMIFPETGLSGRLLPNDLSAFLNQYYTEKGVNILPEHFVDSIQKSEEKYIVHYQHVATHSPAEKTFDSVIVGIGLKPDLSLAESAGIETENGIIVDDFLQTSRSDIFAAGDVASFYNYGLGKQTRVEHEDNANKMGMRAGMNMSGEMEKYDHFPFFYSDLFDLGYEALGEFDKEYQIVQDWINPFRKGTLYYLQDEKIRGLIFWNLWGNVDRGREIIQTGKAYKINELMGLFKDD